MDLKTGTAEGEKSIVTSGFERQRKEADWDKVVDGSKRFPTYRRLPQVLRSAASCRFAPLSGKGSD